MLRGDYLTYGILFVLLSLPVFTIYGEERESYSFSFANAYIETQISSGSSYASPIYSVGAESVTSGDAPVQETSDNINDGLLGGSVKPPEDEENKDPASPIGSPFFLIACVLVSAGYKYAQGKLVQK